MLPSPGATSLNASASTSVTTAFGLTRPRKRATPTLGGIENAFASPKEGGVPNKFASPSSVYSEGGAQEGEEQNDVIRFGATSAEVEGEEEEGPDFHEIRLVESPVVKSISNVPLPLARSLCVFFSVFLVRCTKTDMCCHQVDKHYRQSLARTFYLLSTTCSTSPGLSLHRISPPASLHSYNSHPSSACLSAANSPNPPSRTVPSLHHLFRVISPSFTGNDSISKATRRSKRCCCKVS